VAGNRDSEWMVRGSGNKARRLMVFLAAIFIPLWPAQAQQASVVQANLVLATDAVHADSIAKAAVIAEVTPGYHINAHKPSLDYLIPTDVKMSAAPQAKLVSAEYPKAKLLKFPFADAPLAVYEGRVVVATTLRISPSIQPGTYTLDGEFSYQACNDHACLPPAHVPLTLSLRVVPAGVALKSEHADVFGKSPPHPRSTN
jgi:thioredoxin:protein disulfide reductase